MTAAVIDFPYVCEVRRPDLSVEECARQIGADVEALRTWRSLKDAGPFAPGWAQLMGFPDIRDLLLIAPAMSRPHFPLDPVHRSTSRLVADIDTHLALGLSDPDLTEFLRTYRERLASRPVVGFFGPFDAGKTTLINTLLGQPFLPTALTPTTSVPVYIRHVRFRPAWVVAEALVLDADFDPDRWCDQEHVCRHLLTEGDRETVWKLGIHDSSAVAGEPPVCILLFLESPVLEAATLLDLPGADHNEADADAARSQAENVDIAIYARPYNAFFGGESDRKRFEGLAASPRCAAIVVAATQAYPFSVSDEDLTRITMKARAGLEELTSDTSIHVVPFASEFESRRRELFSVLGRLLSDRLITGTPAHIASQHPRATIEKCLAPAKEDLRARMAAEALLQDEVAQLELKSKELQAERAAAQNEAACYLAAVGELSNLPELDVGLLEIRVVDGVGHFDYDRHRLRQQARTSLEELLASRVDAWQRQAQCVSEPIPEIDLATAHRLREARIAEANQSVSRAWRVENHFLWRRSHQGTREAARDAATHHALQGLKEIDEALSPFRDHLLKRLHEHTSRVLDLDANQADAEAAQASALQKLAQASLTVGEQRKVIASREMALRKADDTAAALFDEFHRAP